MFVSVTAVVVAHAAVAGGPLSSQQSVIRAWMYVITMHVHTKVPVGVVNP